MAGPLDYVNPQAAAPVGLDPFLLAGLGVMGQAGQPGGLGSGIMQGLQMYSQMQQADLANQQARQDLARTSKWADYVRSRPREEQQMLEALGPEAGAAYIAKLGVEAAKQQGGAWQGTGFQAQAANTYNALMGKVKAGVPLTPEEETNLSIAYQTLTAPKTYATPEGTHTVPGMSLPGVPGMVGGPGVAPPGAPGGPSGFTPAKATEGERKAASLYGRMSRANAALTDLEGRENFDPAAFSGRAVKDFIGGRMKESPGPFTAMLGALITSDDYNLYTTAAGDFIASMLRYDSGAAVPDTEFYRYYSVYFPTPGEGPEVRAAKAQRRAAAEEALRLSAGRGLDEAERRQEAEKISKEVTANIPLPTPPAPQPPAPTSQPAPDTDEEEVPVNF